MILRSIRVESWRSLVLPVELGPFDSRINIVHAPNGTGKSTVFEALRRGLMDPHTVSGKEVEALRPWGRVLAPTVTLEFARRDGVYKLQKRFSTESLWRGSSLAGRGPLGTLGARPKVRRACAGDVVSGHARAGALAG